MSGVKHDQEKVRLELIPPELIFGVGEILTFGAKKYGDRNWERGMEWGRVYGALQRHLNAWWSGEETDAETGKSHLWHAGCCLAFLMAYEARGIGEDDRPGDERVRCVQPLSPEVPGFTDLAPVPSPGSVHRDPLFGGAK